MAEQESITYVLEEYKQLYQRKFGEPPSLTKADEKRVAQRLDAWFTPRFLRAMLKIAFTRHPEWDGSQLGLHYLFHEGVFRTVQNELVNRGMRGHCDWEEVEQLTTAEWMDSA